MQKRAFSKFQSVRRPQKVVFQKHTKNYKTSLPQSYFIELKDTLAQADDKEKAVKVVLPEVKKQIEKGGLSARQIYKIMHPIAMLDLPATN